MTPPEPEGIDPKDIGPWRRLAELAADPATAEPARLAALPQMSWLSRSRRPTSSRPRCCTSVAVAAASAAFCAITSAALSRSMRPSYL